MLSTVDFALCHVILNVKGPTLRKWYIILETIRWKPPAGLAAKIAADQVILQWYSTGI